MPATEVTHDTVHRVDPGDVDLTLLHDPLHQRTSRAWTWGDVAYTIAIALTLLGAAAVATQHVWGAWVGW